MNIYSCFNIPFTKNLFVQHSLLKSVLGNFFFLSLSSFKRNFFGSAKTYYMYFTLREFHLFACFGNNITLNLGRLHNSAQHYWHFACLNCSFSIRKTVEACLYTRPAFFRAHSLDFACHWRIFSPFLRIISYVYSINVSDLFSHIQTRFNSSKF